MPSSAAMAIDNLFSPTYYVNTTTLVIGFEFFLLLHLFIDRKRIHAFFSQFKSEVLAESDNGNKDTKQFIKKATRPDRIEIGTVLKNLGITCSDATEITSIEADDIFRLFDEKNPTLDEVREAFDVFDDNKDGFIDTMEVQRVLRALGLNEGSSVEDCRRMITVHDSNNDGVLDFDEFVKFMETVSC